MKKSPEALKSEEIDFVAISVRNCPLRRANVERRKAGVEDIKFRCRRITCDACARLAIRERNKQVHAVLFRWNFQEIPMTLNLPIIPYEELNAANIKEFYGNVYYCLGQLEKEPKIEACLIKPEFATGRDGDKEGYRLHMHVLALVRGGNWNELRFKEIFSLFEFDIKISQKQGKPLEGWLKYLEKPSVTNGLHRGSKTKYKCKPKYLRRLRMVLNKYMYGKVPFVVFGGFFDGRKERYPRIVMGKLIPIYKKHPWKGPLLRLPRLKAISKLAKQFESVSKWKHLAPFYKFMPKLKKSPLLEPLFTK